MEPKIVPETAVTNYQSTLRNIPEEKKLIYTAAEARNHSTSIINSERELVDPRLILYEHGGENKNP